MEDRQTAQGQGIEEKSYIYNESNIESFIISYFESIGIPSQDIRSEKQQSFTACLMAIGKQLFPVGFWQLKAFEFSAGVKTNHNSYDMYKLALLAQEYTYIVNKYNKMASLYDYSYLANISYTTCYSWGNISNTNYNSNTVNNILSNYISNNGIVSIYSGEELNLLRIYVYKIIQDARKQIFESKLIDTRQGVSLMYLGNNSPDLLPTASAGQGAGFSLESVADSLQIAQK